MQEQHAIKFSVTQIKINNALNVLESHTLKARSLAFYYQSF